MEIVIGRKADNGQLKVAVEGKPERAVGALGSVPPTVSRSHFSLQPDDKGGYKLTNLNPANETLVNGVSVETTHVKEGDRIELGASRYLFDWKHLDQVVPSMIDIKPLEAVWDNYQQRRMKMQIRQGRLNAIGRVAGVVSMAGTVFAVVGKNSDLRLVLLISAIVLSLLLSAVTFINASKMPKKMAELDKEFQLTYTCPKCGVFMGNQPYHVLRQRPACPYCRGKFIIMSGVSGS